MFNVFNIFYFQVMVLFTRQSAPSAQLRGIKHNVKSAMALMNANLYHQLKIKQNMLNTLNIGSTWLIDTP